MPDRSVTYVFKGQFTNLTAGLTAAGRNVTELGAKMTALDKNGARMRSGLTSLGSTAGKIGLVAAAGLGAAVVAAANFDKSMSAVQAATHETTANMQLLRAAAIKAGADTAYSATEAASAIEELAKAGVSTKDILDGGLSGALNLAAAGAIDVADAAELAATAMTQFKLGGDQVNHVADLLAAGAGKAQGGVDDLGMALKQSGLVAAQTGLSIEETTGALAEFAANGLIGSDAGTSFKTMLQALSPSSVKAADLMKDLGLNAYDAQGNFVGLENYAGQLKESLGKLSVEQQNAALKTIFGSDAVRAASIIFKDGAEGVAEWRGKVDDAGYAAETASTRMDNLSGDLEQFKGSLETALIGAGDGSQGPLRSLVQGATDVVNAFNKLPESGQNAATGLLAVTAITGGSLWFGAKVVGGIASTREALEQLGVSSEKTSKGLRAAGTAAGALTVLFAVGTAIDEVWKSSDRAVPGVEALTKSLIGLGDAQAAQNLQKQLGDIGDALETINDPGFFADFQGKVDGLFGDSIGAAATTGLFGNKLQSSKQELREATEAVDALDAALANIVTTGSPEQAAKALADLADAQGLSADKQKKLLTLLPQYKEAVDGASNATTLAAGATDDYGTAASQATEDAKKLADALKEQRNDAREVAQGFVGLGNKVDDAKVSLNEWLRSLEKQARALQDFTANARTAAKRGLDDGLIASLEKAGPAGALRMKQLADGTDKEIARANRAWAAGQRAVKEYVNQVAGVPKSATTTIHASTSQAVGAIANVRAALDQLHNKTVTINTIRQGVGLAHAANALDGRADGGSVPKTGLGYADRHPYMLADGEEVISNRRGQADRYRPLLKAINNAADGTTVGGGRAGFSEVVLPTTIGGATADIVALRKTIRSLTADVKESDQAIKQETRERDHAAKVVDKNQAEVERLNGLYSSLSSSIQAGLAANQFERGSVWSSGGGFAGIIDRLNASTANANAMTKATTALSGSLTGAALQSVLEQGLGTTQMFAGLSAAQLKQYQADFDKNAAALQRAGGAGGAAVYGRDQQKANLILAASQAELARQTAELRTVTAQNAIAQRQRDRAEKLLGQVKDVLGDLKSEAKKSRGDRDSGTRSHR